MMLDCCTDESSGQTKNGTQVLSGFPGFHLLAAFRWIIAGIIQKTYPCKSRCHTNSHSARMMVGMYIFQLIELVDFRSVSSVCARLCNKTLICNLII